MNRKDDPFYEQMVYHIAKHIRADGAVSALCYKTPRPINLKRGQSWVLEAKRATCPKCRKIAAGGAPHA